SNRKMLSKKWIKKIFLTITKKVESSFSKYIFLTDGMNQIVNKKNKPYIIMEGIYNDNQDYTLIPKNNKTIILYAGSLFKDYGIEMVLKSFDLINDFDCELHIYGSGDQENLVREYANKNKNIK